MHPGKVFAQASGLLKNVDKKDMLFAPAAPGFSIEALHVIKRELEAVFLALGQALAVPGEVLGLKALVQGFEIGDGHGRRNGAFAKFVRGRPKFAS